MKVLYYKTEPRTWSAKEGRLVSESLVSVTHTLGLESAERARQAFHRKGFRTEALSKPTLQSANIFLMVMAQKRRRGSKTPHFL